jgi:hypothetical protein
MWHKTQDKPSQGMADWPRVGRFPKPIFTTCQSELVRGVSNVGKAVQGGNLATRASFMVGQPIKWARCDQSLATVPPYFSYKYHGAPPSRKCEEGDV